MSEPSTENLGEDLLTWFREGFRAKIFRAPAKEKESEENDPDFGKRWQESSVRYDLATSTWKTHQCSSPEDLPWSSVILPKWGLMRNGVVYQRRTAERPIAGRGSGLWPTPCAMEPEKNLEHFAAKRMRPYSERGGGCGPNLATKVKMFPTPTVGDSKNSANATAVRNNPNSKHHNGTTLVDAVRMFPTPSVSASRQGQNESDGRRGQTLTGAARGQRWPTPRNNTGPSQDDRHLSLDGAVKRWPTPLARDWRSGKGSEESRRKSKSLPEEIRGLLNPDWEELLMGWPMGWTSMESLDPEEFDRWPKDPSMWLDGSWEEGVPRIVEPYKGRNSRVEAIGNGQFPLAAATAWRILTGGDDDR